MSEKPNYKEIIEEIEVELKSIQGEGKVANYIPELAKINPDKFAFHISSVDGENYGFGDEDDKFSIQSISKVFSLTLAYKLSGEALWQRVGVEPSGNPFNSLIQLEQENGIPRNPLINSGAIVICDILYEIFYNKPRCNGVSPLLFGILTSAFAFINNSTILTCPRNDP